MLLFGWCLGILLKSDALVATEQTQKQKNSRRNGRGDMQVEFYGVGPTEPLLALTAAGVAHAGE